MKQQTSPSTELSEDEENLVANTADEFSDHQLAGENPDIQEYLQRLPDNRLKQHFLIDIGMDTLLRTMESMRSGAKEELLDELRKSGKLKEE